MDGRQALASVWGFLPKVSVSLLPLSPRRRPPHQSLPDSPPSRPPNITSCRQQSPGSRCNFISPSRSSASCLESDVHLPPWPEPHRRCRHLAFKSPAPALNLGKELRVKVALPYAGKSLIRDNQSSRPLNRLFISYLALFPSLLWCSAAIPLLLLACLNLLSFSAKLISAGLSATCLHASPTPAANFP